MDSESDCEDALEDTLTRSQESGGDDHDDLEDTFTISQFQRQIQPESEPDSKVNSIRFYNNPSYQSNQMRRMRSENPIHSSEISKLSLLQVPSDSHALNIRCVDAAASESMECLAGIGGLLTSAALAARQDLRRSRGGGPAWRLWRALDGRESGYRPPRHRRGGAEQGCRRCRLCCRRRNRRR
jgi:hypothetical protein